MVNSRSVSANKNDPIGPVGTIVSKSVVNLRNIPVKQKTKWDKQPENRLRQIAVAAYYRACSAYSFEDGYEVTGRVRGRN